MYAALERKRMYTAVEKKKRVYTALKRGKSVYAAFERDHREKKKNKIEWLFRSETNTLVRRERKKKSGEIQCC